MNYYGIEFEFEMKPVPKQSFRAGKVNYQPEKVTTNKALLQWELQRQIREFNEQEKINQYFENPVQLFILCVYPIPKSWSKKRVAALKENPFNGWFAAPKTSTPDTDNISKQIKDSFQGILYKNDSQVFHDQCVKGYDFIQKEKIIVDVFYFSEVV